MNPIDLKDDVIVFDIDGVLVKFDFEIPDVAGNGKTVHAKCFPEHEWVLRNMHCDMYASAQKTELFDVLIKQKDPRDLYVLSTAASSFEQDNKIRFIERNYPAFLKENIIFAGSDAYKTDILSGLRERYDMDISSGKRSLKHGARIILIEDSLSIMISVENRHDEYIRCFHVSDFI